MKLLKAQEKLPKVMEFLLGFLQVQQLKQQQSSQIEKKIKVKLLLHYFLIQEKDIFQQNYLKNKTKDVAYATSFYI